MSSRTIVALVFGLTLVAYACSAESSGEVPEASAQAVDTRPPAELILTHLDDGIQLVGRVPDQTERDRVLSSVTRRFTEVSLVDSLAVDDVAPAHWRDLLPDVLDLLDEMLPSADLTLRGRTVLISGETDQEDLRAELGERIRTTAGDGFRVQYRVRLTLPGAAEVAAGIERILSDQQIEFAHVRSQLTEVSHPILDSVALLLARYPEVSLRIEGHMDGVPEDATITRVSRLRADEVRLYLMDAGISQNRLRAVGVGGSEPLAPVASAEGRRRNNRIEFHVIGNN